MLFVCHPKSVSINSNIYIEIFGKSGSIAMLSLKPDDVQKIAIEMLVEVQRRKGEFL